MTTASEFQNQVGKTITNMDRIQRFVNGGPTETVETDSGEVSTLAKLQADVGAAADAQESATLSQAWSEGTLPGGPGTKSAREWAGEAGIQFSRPLAPFLRVASTLQQGLDNSDLDGEIGIVVSDGIQLYDVRGNMYNPATRVTGSRLSGTGAIISEAGAVRTDFIPVIAGEPYTVSTNTTRRLGLAFYDASLTLVPGSYNASSALTLTVTAPPTAAFIIFNLEVTGTPEPTQVILNRGASALPFTAFGVKVGIIGQKLASSTAIDRITETRVSSNLYNPAAKVTGQRLSNTGNVISEAGAARTEYIPIVAGQTYTISANAAKRQGVSFFDGAFALVAGSYNGTTSLPLTVTAPVGAVYLVVNLAITGTPEPSEVMIAQGATALPFEPFGSRSIVDTANGFWPPFSEQAGTAALTEFAGAVESRTSANLYIAADKQVGFLVNNSGAVAAASGWACSAYIPITPGQQYTIASNDTRRAGLAFYDASRVYIAGSVNLSADNVVTVTAPVGAAFLVFNLQSPVIPEPSEIMVTATATAQPYEPGGPRIILVSDALWPPIETQEDDTGAVLFLNQAGNGYIESSKSGVTIRRNFNAFPDQAFNDDIPVCFNFGNDVVNGVTVRSNVGDDIAPDHLFNTTLGANHGYAIGRCTAAAHGKTLADQGAVYTNGGVQHIIVQVIDANTLLVANRTSNVNAATGTYTHVSGGTNTGSFTVSASTQSQWYPAFSNYDIKLVVDGKVVTERDGTFNYRNSVQFIETYDMLSRADQIAWWEANAAGVERIRPQTADPSVIKANTYEFDRDGQLTIYQQWYAIKSAPMRDLMCLQAGRAAGTTGYYIPNTLPFTDQAQSWDYNLIEPADRTSSGGLNSIFITQARIEATGPAADRVLSLIGSNALLAMGVLPVGDGAFAERRNEVTRYFIEIRGNTDKVYIHAVDKGDRTMAAGEYYSTISYRHILPASTDRTAAYVVRTQGDDYVFVDWHNKSGLDRVPLPTDLYGRAYEVVASKNATALSATLTGDLLVNVSATGSYGYLILKVAA